MGTGTGFEYIVKGPFYDDNGNVIPLSSFTNSTVHISFDLAEPSIEITSDHISQMLEDGDMDVFQLFTKIHGMYEDHSQKIRMLELIIEYLFESYHSRNNLLINYISSLERDYDNVLKGLRNIKKEL